MQLLFTPRARDDLEDIWQFSFERWSAEQADAYLADLYGALDRLRQFPELGPLRTEFSPPVRVLPHRQHIAIYLIVGNDVLIIRVRHAREDWQNDPASKPG